MTTTQHCAGCRDNFYNGNNGLGVKQCWCLAKAKLVTKFRIGRDVPMNIREAYVKVRVPSCYHDWYCYLDQIPSYAQSREQRAAEKECESYATPFPSGETGPYAVSTITINPYLL
jgi:hypothetical protein